MEKDFEKKLQQEKLHAKLLQSKRPIRSWNMAKRLDLGHTKAEAKKGKAK